MQDGDALADRHRLGLIVRHVDHRGAERAVEGEQLRAQLDAQRAVETRERLVEQKRLWTTDDGAAQGHALALTLRQVLRHAIEHVLQAEPRRGLEHAAGDLRIADVPHGERKRDVVADTEVGIQRVALKHHRDVALGGRLLCDDALADDDVTRRRLLEPRDAAQHGGLAGARSSEQHQQLTVPHLEIQVVQRLNAACEDLAQAAECDRRHRLCRQADRNARAIPYTIAHTTKPVTITPGIFSIGFVVPPVVAITPAQYAA